MPSAPWRDWTLAARKSIELRFFGDLSVDETADVLGGVAADGDARLETGACVADARVATSRHSLNRAQAARVKRTRLTGLDRRRRLYMSKVEATKVEATCPRHDFRSRKARSTC